MPKSAIVKASELGNCWAAVRFTRGCQACDHYETCKLPERQANPAYDALTQRAADLRDQAKELVNQARAMEQGQRRMGAGYVRERDKE